MSGRPWRGSRYFNHPCLYKENGFKERKDAEELIAFLSSAEPRNGTIASIEKKKETKNPPLLYNLAELQNDCSKMFKISPDQTLKAVQELMKKTCYLSENGCQGTFHGGGKGNS